MSAPKTKTPDDDGPAKTYFEHARRFPQPGGARPGDAYPKLPSENPWATDLPAEPTIDRSEDA
jgi:hypothetical protein